MTGAIEKAAERPLVFSRSTVLWILGAAGGIAMAIWYGSERFTRIEAEQEQQKRIEELRDVRLGEMDHKINDLAKFVYQHVPAKDISFLGTDPGMLTRVAEMESAPFEFQDRERDGVLEWAKETEVLRNQIEAIHARILVLRSLEQSGRASDAERMERFALEVQYEILKVKEVRRGTQAFHPYSSIK